MFAGAWPDLGGWSGSSEQCSVQGQLHSFNAEKTDLLHPEVVFVC